MYGLECSSVGQVSAYHEKVSFLLWHDGTLRQFQNPGDEGKEGHSHLLLHSEFEANQDYMRFCFKKLHIFSQSPVFWII